jgi:hypothetical protein
MGQLWWVATCTLFGVFQPWHALIALVIAAMLPESSRVRPSLLYVAFVGPLVTYGSWLVFQSAAFDWFPMLCTTTLIFVPALWLWFKPSGRFLFR